METKERGKGYSLLIHFLKTEPVKHENAETK